MDILDFIVFFLYIIIFNFLFSAFRKRYKDPVLRSYHRTAFWVKVVASFAYSIFVLYISRGDTSALFFPEGNNIYKMILEDQSKIDLFFIPSREFDESLLWDSYNKGYLKVESNYAVTKAVAFFSFFTHGKFLAINLIFAMIAFTGVWRLYLFFYEQYPQLHKQFAIGILYLPTFVFWSSGILKDSLCIAALGWITYSTYHLIYDRKNIILNMVFILLSAYVLIVLKVYILVSYIPFFLMFMMLRNITFLKSVVAKLGLIAMFIVVSVFGFIELSQNTEQALGSFASQGLTKSIATYQHNYEVQQSDGSSSFSLGVEFDGSLSSLARLAPAAIIATLYRPFIWESRKLSTLMSSLESLALMIFTIIVIYRVGLLSFFKSVISQPIITYCLFFSLIFALFVGATTLNFGSLVRYKIPAMPFYVCGLFLVLYLNGKLSPAKPVKMYPGPQAAAEAL